MSQYISIKEFAERAGVSTQAIYQRLTKDLQSYCKEVKGKKCLDTAALELFGVDTLQSDCKEVAKDLPSDCKEVASDLQSTLAATITALQAQLAVKDEQLAAKDQQIEKLTTALLNEQQSAQQAHALHAGTMQHAALIETRTATAAEQPAPAEVTEDKKRGWRLWRK